MEQAASDLNTYEILARSTLPACHRLHYLQMWLEKLCKAHLYFESDQRQFTHKFVAKHLPKLVIDHWRRTNFQAGGIAGSVRELCREIDQLHPQVDNDGRSPDNVEYPWISMSGRIETPAKWHFRLADRLETHPGRLLLKAAAALTRDPVFRK
ncbi:MAG: hypothetical protein WBS24_04805 [Terriglobales bacterium]